MMLLTAAPPRGEALTFQSALRRPGAGVIRRHSPVLICCLLLAFLSGCAVQRTVVEPGTAVEFEARRQELAALASWRLRGRISVQTGKDAWSATLHWRQDDENYSMRVIAPLGGGSYEIEGDRDGVSMQTADDRLLLADRPEVLMQDHFGWHVPLTGLRYWVRGIPEPAPQPDSLVLDPDGRLSSLEQSGWRVDYSRYVIRDAFQLPRTLTLHHEELRVKLVILEWELLQ